MNIFNKLLGKAYLFAKFKGEQLLRAGKLRSDLSLATVADDAHIDYSAIIQNPSGDRSKITIGSKSWIRGYLMVNKKEGEIIIGNNCIIGTNSYVWSTKKIKIGDRVLIAHNVNIHDNNSHPLESLSRHEDFMNIFEKGFQDLCALRAKEIIIEDDVWLGYNSIILKGVTIGKGAIIGAGTVIKSDVPPYAVVVGNPAQIIKYTA